MLHRFSPGFHHRILGMFLLMVVFAVSVRAQGDRGTVTGLVMDASRAAVVGARVTIVNSATNLSLETISNDTGSYRFINVPIGIYTLRAASPGFQTHERQDVQVQVNQTTVIDVEFQVGSTTETVTVTGAAIPLISTESSDVGMVVDSKRFLELPLTLGGGMRNPSSFIRLSPGVSPRSTWNKSISGGGSFQDQIYYDGIALSRGDISNDAEVNPSVDAIAEFKLITNNYSAEYAHAVGGITTFTMKSGTNQLHGNGFGFVRNDKLDARGFFSPAKSPMKQSEWGGTIGGPVVIPRLYNGRDRTFWFFSFDQFYYRGGQLTQVNTIPTVRMQQQGDFSELPRIIYDPASTRQLPDGSFARDPFSGNIIPKSRWSKVSAAMLPYHPLPDRPGVTANYTSPLTDPWQDHRHTGGKFDHIFNPGNRLSVMFNYTDRPALKSRGGEGNLQVAPLNDPTNSALAGWVSQRVTTRVLSINFDTTISPTTINHVGLGFSRFRNPFQTIGFNQGWTQPDGGKLGLKGLQYDLFPLVRFDTDNYAWYGARSAIDNFFNTYTALDTVTLIRGAHTIKLGAEMQYHQDNFREWSTGGGAFYYWRNETGDPRSFGNTGDAWASFLLGVPHQGEAFFKATQPSGRYTDWGIFVDETWKATPSLTITAALRWEIISPHADRAGRISYVDIGKANAEAGNRNGVLVFGGDQGFGTRYLNVNWKNFAPRLGFAYRVGKNTTLRGGAGVFFANYNNYNMGLPQVGFSFQPSFITGDNGITPAFNWDNGFPQNFARPPNYSPYQLNGFGGTAVIPEWRMQEKLQWNFTVERQFADDFAVSASYVASKGSHIMDQQFINQLMPAAQKIAPALLRANILSDAARAAGYTEPYPGFAALWGARATVAQSLRPYPQYGDLAVYGSFYGNSNYQSFQFKLDKRYKGGLSGTLAYTFSKFLTDARAMDAFSGRQDAYRREKSFANTDLPQILTFSLSYQLPFGPGKRWGNGLHGAAGVLAQGWQLATVASYTSGDRLGVATNNTLPFFNPGLRPNQVAGRVRSDISMDDFDPNVHQYLLREAFENPAPGQFGSAPRYLNVRGPMRLDESFAVFKDTRISERWRHQFRLEIVNPLNRVVFGNPVTNFAAGNFGRIVNTSVAPRNIQFGMKLFF